MLLNEHNSKLLFTELGIPVPAGETLFPGDEKTFKASFKLPWYLKAQVLTGGRGKAGGIVKVETTKELAQTAHQLLQLTIKGHPVPFLRVEPAAQIKNEFYLSLTVSRERKCFILTVGKKGGVNIESLGKENLLVQEVKLPGGLAANQIRAAFFHLELGKELYTPFSEILSKLFEGMVQYGLLLSEINPLALTQDDTLIALDGKVEIDDNFADLFPQMERFYQREHATKEENLARDAGLSFVRLPGWVGLMVNGAGLAMATMDLLNFSGLPASNFLDLGGGANETRMRIAFDLLFEDAQVRAIFINLFGGILSCEKVAKAMQAGLNGKTPPKPIVVRMSGKDSKEGLAILEDMEDANIHIATNMDMAISRLNDFKPESNPRMEFSFDKKSANCIQSTTTNYTTTCHFDISRDTPILVQGITGREGQLHTQLMREYGARIVAGVTPFKGGEKVQDIPVYNSIVEARREHEIGASIIFVPPKMAADAIVEAAFNKIPWVICITEGIPQHQMLSVFEQIKDTGTRVIGPNTPGIIVPDQTKIGILPAAPFTRGSVAILSRSGTLTYEAAARLSDNGIGQSLCVGIGGDPFIGTNFVDMFEMLRNHTETKAVVVLGEIGGQAEENLAEYVARTGFSKPVIAFIAGRTAPPGKKLGHAGAILEKATGIDEKIAQLRNSGIWVCPSLENLAQMTASVLK